MAIRRGDRDRHTDLLPCCCSPKCPKTFAALYPERIAFPAASLLAPLQKVMFPLVWLLNGITSLTLRLFGIRTNVRISDAVSMSCALSCANPSRKSPAAIRTC